MVELMMVSLIEAVLKASFNKSRAELDWGVKAADANNWYKC
jgi:hypothetical protein